MAQSTVDPAALSCSVCLEELKEPVTIPCGHSYCSSCIHSHWDTEETERPVYSCPQCRQSFSSRPVTLKNIMLAGLVEELRRSGLTAPPVDRCYAGPGDVSCDVCTGRKLKALRSCLQCVASYCERHLQPHHDAAALQRHQLVAPSHHLQENMCSEHNEVKKMFCRTDGQLLCLVCCTEEHAGHDTMPSASERAQREAQQLTTRVLHFQSIQHKETDLQRLQQEAQDISCSAQRALQHNGDSFREIALLLEKRRSEVEQQIRSQEKTQLRLVQELQNQMQQDMTVSSSEMIPLSFSCLKSRNQTELKRDFEGVSRSVSALRDKLQLILKEAMVQVQDELRPDPSCRDDFLRYSRDITLDPNTIETHLSMSYVKRRVTQVRKEQNYPDHPDRFIDYEQAVSREELTGRCYWELKWTGRVRIAVTYKDTERDCGFGNNEKSWALDCDDTGYTFVFNGVWSEISSPVESRVGVYLDHSAGALSFYSVQGQTMRLLHRVQTQFTRPLHAGVWVTFGDVHFPELN